MTALSKNTNHYHRFIPKEEVQEVSAWQFQPMGEHPPPPPAPEVPVEPPPAEPTLEEVRTQAHAEGFEHGRLAGAQATRTALEQPLRELQRAQATKWNELLSNLEQELGQVRHQLSQQVLALVCDLARQVVRCELQTPAAAIEAVVQEALELVVADAQPAVVRLHPDDLALVEAAMAGNPHASNVRWQGDDAVTAGGCLVETPSGGVDGSVEKRWTRAVANLGLSAPWTPGEDADV